MSYYFVFGRSANSPSVTNMSFLMASMDRQDASGYRKAWMNLIREASVVAESQGYTCDTCALNVLSPS